MIATWMLYCSLCALGLAAAAALAERTLLAGRGSVRFLWIAAVVLSLLVPAAALRSRPVPAARSEPVAVQQLSGRADHARVASPQFSPDYQLQPRPQPPRRDWRATLARFDAPLAIVWITLSLALLFDFLGGIIVLAWMRRRWQQHTVLGVSVLVSERTGPAVVGTVKPEIVVPEWVLALEPAQLELMLRHEQEHRRAGDGRLIAGAKLALMVMPWNIALWWQILRLRSAVELDCDARVLQNADARSYGDLLLEMARPRRGPRLIGATAFAERATQLERRIRVLGRHSNRTTQRARALATAIGLVALTVAWIAPHPAVPVTVVALPVAEKQTQPNVAPANAPVINADNPVAMPLAAATRQTATRNDEQQPAAVVAISRELETPPNLPTQPIAALPPCARAGGPEVAPIVDDVFNRLFEGITLSDRQEQQACAILMVLQARQATHDQAVSLAMAANQARRAQRDAALRALLTNDVDRAAFDTHLAAQAAGARGGRGGGGGGRARSGNATADTMMVAERARGGRAGGGVVLDTLATRRVQLREGVARSGGGGRGRGGGARGAGDGFFNDSALAAMTRVSNEATLRRLFADISLTPDQQTRARELIASHQQDVQTQRPPRPEVILRVNPNSGAISMQAEGVNELLALVASEADRAKVQSRVTAVGTVQR